MRFFSNFLFLWGEKTHSFLILAYLVSCPSLPLTQIEMQNEFSSLKLQSEEISSLSLSVNQNPFCLMAPESQGYHVFHCAGGLLVEPVE